MYEISKDLEGFQNLQGLAATSLLLTVKVFEPFRFFCFSTFVYNLIIADIIFYLYLGKNLDYALEKI